MKISKQTVDILQNFTKINQSIIINEGKVLRTIDSEKAVFARAEIEDEFPQDFALYSLNEFLTVIKDLFDNNPDDIEFGDESMKITKAGTTARYRYTAKDRVIGIEKDINLSEPVTEFPMGSDVVQKLVKTRSIMNLDFLVVRIEDDKIYAEATMDKKGKSRSNTDADNAFRVELGDCQTEGMNGNKYAVKIEHLQMIPSDYRVGVHVKGKAGALSFTSNNLKYVVSMDKPNTEIVESGDDE